MPVLIVDPNVPWRRRLKALLESQGVATLDVANIADAVRCLAARSVDATVAEMQLPDGSALDLLRTIKREVNAVTFYLCSDRVALDVAVVAGRHGAAAVFEKRQPLNQLVKMLLSDEGAVKVGTTVHPRDSSLRAFAEWIDISSARGRPRDSRGHGASLAQCPCELCRLLMLLEASTVMRIKEAAWRLEMPRSLVRAAVRSSGRTFHQWTRLARILRTIRSIQAGNRIQQSAHSAGYPQARQFNRDVKIELGIGPKQLKERIRGSIW